MLVRLREHGSHQCERRRQAQAISTSLARSARLPWSRSRSARLGMTGSTSETLGDLLSLSEQTLGHIGLEGVEECLLPFEFRLPLFGLHGQQLGHFFLRNAF